MVCCVLSAVFVAKHADLGTTVRAPRARNLEERLFAACHQSCLCVERLLE